MRERAELIGARLDVWTQTGIGTEVDLKVPGDRAYATPAHKTRIWSLTGRAGGLS
jgi:hypothetical protein